MTAEIPLTRGMVTLVDDADAEWLLQWKWHASGGKSGIYAARWSKAGNGKRVLLLMHREIVGADPESEVDHRDLNKLNNQRSNLRIATVSQNQANRHMQSNCKYGFKGVRFRADRGTYFAVIKVNGREKFKCGFATPEEAHEHWKIMALEAFGDFARFE